MKVLYILPFHNSSAALFDNNQCLAYLHEEKFNNLKNYWGFPLLSLEYLHKNYNLSNLDKIVFSSKQLFLSCVPSQKNNLTQISENFLTNNLKKHISTLGYYINPKIFSIFRNFFIDSVISPLARKKMTSFLSNQYKISSNNIYYFDHHTCHALSPIHFYNLHHSKKKTLIFTADGSGDNCSSKLFIYSPKKGLKEVSKSPYYASLGLLFSGATEYLGMKPNEHEYKVMGLAAYVSDKKYYQPILDKLNQIISLNKQSLSFESSINLNNSTKFFAKNFSNIRFDNISAGVQVFIQDLILNWIKLTIKKYKINQIACSGGLFMNVKLNKMIQELPEVKKVYFMPSAGDDSLGYGASFIANKKQISDFSLYKGVSYSENQIQEYLSNISNNHSFSITYKKDVVKTIAKLLSKKEIVGWFQGKGEWGARSLCNRTILANSSDYRSYNQVNDTIKMRDFWMPFAPTMLYDWAPKYILNWKKTESKIKESSKYMITAFDTTPLAQKHLLAATHQKDHTIRPQLVQKNDNPLLYKMLKEYEKLTGMGGLMNTSLNIHGYPLVGTIEQAVFTFQNSNLKYLVIDNYLLTKNE